MPTTLTKIGMDTEVVTASEAVAVTLAVEEAATLLESEVATAEGDVTMIEILATTLTA